MSSWPRIASCPSWDQDRWKSDKGHSSNPTGVRDACTQARVLFPYLQLGDWLGANRKSGAACGISKAWEGNAVVTSRAYGHQDGLTPPSRLNLALEGRGLLDIPALLAAAPFLSMAPRGKPHIVLVLPGMGANDRSTLPLRGFLRWLGYDARGWGRGRNIRLPTMEIPAIVGTVKELFETSGTRVSLIVWSLGGILAREVARNTPAQVRMVITLGSPFAAPSANNIRTIWRLLTGEPVVAANNTGRVTELAKPLPVPATSIFTRSDGVVAWQACLEQEGPERENIEVNTTHIGLGFHAPAFWAIADRLAQPDGAWTPFQPSAPVAPFFPRRR